MIDAKENTVYYACYRIFNTNHPILLPSHQFTPSPLILQITHPQSLLSILLTSSCETQLNRLPRLLPYIGVGQEVQ